MVGSYDGLSDCEQQGQGSGGRQLMPKKQDVDWQLIAAMGKVTGRRREVQGRVGREGRVAR